MLRFILLAACLCVGTLDLSAQQRFLRFLGQRATTGATLQQGLDVFRAGEPTTATLVFAVTDAAGQVVSTDNTTEAFLDIAPELKDNRDLQHSPSPYLPPPNIQVGCGVPRIGYFYTSSVPFKQRSKAGIIEFSNFGVLGKSMPSFQFFCTSATANGVSVNAVLLGGQAERLEVDTLKNGKLAMPGIASYNSKGSPLPFVEIGKTVQFNNPDTTDLNWITLRAYDKYGNIPSIPSIASISFSYPMNGNLYALGNNAVIDVSTGRAVFKEIKFLGSTASTIFYYNLSLRNLTEKTQALEKETATISCVITIIVYMNSVTFVPGPAVALAPVINPKDSTRRRMPPRFEVGKSNRADTAQWFYVQAVDEFGNRVDRGPNTYNGGTATVRFARPEEGLPRSTSASVTNAFQFSQSTDPFVKANTQVFSALGTTAIARDGLFTFNDFTPLGAASTNAAGDDVVLTFESPTLRGISAPQAEYFGRFPPLPPITTATTTFIRSTGITTLNTSNDERLSVFPNPAQERVVVIFPTSEGGAYALELRTVLGQIVMSQTQACAPREQATISLSVQALNSGMYVVILTTPLGERRSKALTIVR
jgi:hypothetical protein